MGLRPRARFQLIPWEWRHSESTEFRFWLVVIVFSYDDPLSVQGTTIANWGNIFRNYFYLSISCLTVLYIAFFFVKLTETLFMIHTYIHTYINTYIHTCILSRTYFVERSIHLVEEHWLLIITGVQASGVMIDRLLRQCCFVWSKIVGPHSSGNFNDWPLK